ncbi:PD40 domain-containing protein [Paenibacillus contaminans]|uniref:Translocation protein TolB n=1 Tax=Paenibacillus contaminans TaxID=450362 RepID=A0A329MHT7_9BACL|nr:PD40 domain-containing protein [Paenibacillus contaminans]RAV18936.1 hypothetical protein DQG23_22545 [Paenibacillus contaminans]
MKRLRISTLFVMLIVFAIVEAASAPAASAKPEAPKAAFVRDGSLWLKTSRNETPVDRGQSFSDIAWSADGKLLAYVKQKQGAWIHNTETGKKEQVFTSNVRHLHWSPKASLLAFQDESILDVVDATGPAPKPFTNVTGGVGSYVWEPEGQGFLVSTGAQLTPAGWSDVKLYKVPLTENFDASKSKLFYTIPNPPGELFAVGTTTFKWSADGRWIAFIAFPTASLAMDANSLCLLSADGRSFRKIGDMLGHEDWFQWSPEGSQLAYVGGQGRFYAEPKELILYDPAAPGVSVTLTPKGMLDIGFAWQNPAILTVSRGKALGNMGSAFHFPMPGLVNQSAASPTDARAITKPPRGLGDIRPQFLRSSGRLVWQRTNGKGGGDLWLADANGRNQRLWIRSVNGEYAVYGG